MYYSTAKKCLLVSTFLEGLIFGGCNPGPKALSAYGWILQESGPYPDKGDAKVAYIGNEQALKPQIGTSA